MRVQRGSPLSGARLSGARRRMRRLVTALAAALSLPVAMTTAGGAPAHAAAVQCGVDCKNDPAWSKVEAYLKGGAVPSFTYHRFWAQADIALAMGSYADLFE